MVTPLEKIRNFIAMYPGFQILEKFQVDYTDAVPNNAGIFPSGLVEIERRTDIFGTTTVKNQYNFSLYYMLKKSPEDEAAALANADWIMDFQQWVQQQSAYGNAPSFGDEPWRESITAQNGMLYDGDIEGTALYAVQLAVIFYKKYEVK